MCRLAAELEPDLFEVDPLEIDRPQPSYTIETVRQLKQTRGWTRVDWLLGADMLLDLPRWRDPEALLRETNFIILRRPGWEIDWHTLPAKFLPLRSNVVDGPMITISASDIRRRVQVGRSVQYLVPPAVAAYIKEHGLYR
jgi:nicotinate-nucleotide adenylyltransferase